MKEDGEKKRYQKGQFIGLGIAIGLPLGIPIGLAMGNIAIGLPFGLLFGVILGIIWEKIGNKNPIEPSEEEKIRQRRYSWIGVAIGVLLLISIIVLFIAKL